MQLSGMFPEHNRAKFAPYLPDFTYPLLDLCRTSDAALRGDVLRHLALLFLKRGHQEGFWNEIPEYLSALRQLRDSRGSLDDIEALLRYLVRVNPREIPENIKRSLAGALTAETEGWFMTWAEQLREEGREQERKRVEEALARAEAEKKRAEAEKKRADELLSKMRQQTIVLLRLRFGELPERALRAIEAATEEQLFAWQLAADLAELTR